MDMMSNVAANSAELSGRERRTNDRYAGPFDGYRVDIIEMPLSIFDLSRGGCFVNSSHEQEPGVTFTMKIDLPRVGWVTLTAQTLYARSGYGFAVQFVDLDESTHSRLEQGLDHLLDQMI
jgi:PilZ domain-containing protein